MEPEPYVYARQEAPGRPVEITRGGYVMVPVKYRDDALVLLEVLAKAVRDLPERPAADLAGFVDAINPELSIRPPPDWLQKCKDDMDRHIIGTILGADQHCIGGACYLVYEHVTDGRLRCDAPNCPVCSPQT